MKRDGGFVTLYQNKYRVESARRPGWDYTAAGFYFITICTRDRNHYFGEIASDLGAPQMVLSDLGRIAERFWLKIPQQFPFARVDEFVVMPNHVHGIIETVDANRRDAIHRVSNTDGAELDAISDAKSDVINRVSTGGATGNNNPMVMGDSVSFIVRWYKGRVTFETKQIQTAIPFGWQTRFHDHVIRTESELERIRQYIRANPSNWNTDEENRP